MRCAVPYCARHAHHAHTQVLAAADPNAWLSAVPAFNQLLAFVTDNRPKVRVCANAA